MDNERKPIPKTAFDSEYSTEFLREVKFLTEKGIRYTFVKKKPEYGISQFKYKKTPALFSALVEFYAKFEAERKVKKNEVSPEEIRKAREILERAANIVETKDDTI